MTPRLFKRKDTGYWYIRLAETHAKSLKTKDKVEASILFNMTLNELREGKILQLGKFSRIRLVEFKKEYLEGSDIVPKRYLHVSPDTLDNDDLAFRKFIEAVGDLPLREVKRKHIDDFKVRCLNFSLSKTYINIMLRSLRAAFNIALGVNYISENPFLQKRSMLPVLFRLDEAIPRYLSQEEISALFKAIDDPEFYFAVKIFLYTGMRRAELSKLQVQDIDLNNNMIQIKKTKSKRDRSIAIADDLKIILQSKLKTDIGPLFPRWSSPDTMSRLFHKYAKKAGIKARLHDLRHTFGTYLRMGGEHLDVIQKLMGHADIKTTQIYAKVVDASLKEAVNKLRFNIGSGI